MIKFFDYHCSKDGFFVMANRRKKKKRSLFPVVLVSVLAALGVGFALGVIFAPESESSSPVVLTETVRAESDGSYSFRISYVADGEVLETEMVAAGGRIRGTDKTPAGRTILRWTDPNGSEVEPREMRAYTDMRFTAETGPALSARTGYFPDTDCFFLPESPLTRLEYARILHALMENKPPEGEALRDCESPEAAALVSAGLMDAPNGLFAPDEPVTEDSFGALLRPFFQSEAILSALAAVEGFGGDEITRAEAVVVLNSLLGLSGQERECYLPDIQPGYWAESAVKLAAEGRAQKYPAGYINIDGYLYSIDDSGYALKNAFVGSLRFDNNGRFTSGVPILDDHVAAAIRENTDETMDREEMLRAMYNYTRDHYKYLRRNYYLVSDIGWCLDEAVTMYTTGLGNCYCYAAAFWAAARGLGYDALCVSGTIGSERSPHGWVTISMDGGHYVFDVEIEMAYHRDGNDYVDNFKMEHGAAVQKWLYVEMYNYDQVLPMERQYGFEQK